MNRICVLLLVVPTLGLAQSPDSLSFLTAAESIEEFLPQDSLESVLEQSVDGEELSVLDVLENTIRNDSAVSLDIRTRVSTRLQPSKGFNDGTYLGSPFKSYERVRFVQGDRLFGGFLMEKDAGEPKFNDFMSGYICVRELGFVRSVVIGDYLVEAGQGVAVWRGFDARKGSEVVVPVRRNGRGLFPYASSDENNFLRGIASDFAFRPFSVIVFYSKKRVNASIDSAGNVTSIYTAGYFRTTTEQEKRGAFSETTAGVRGAYVLSPQSSVGIVGYQNWFSRVVLVPGAGFEGDRQRIVSVDYRLGLGKLHLFGEWATINSAVGGISAVHAQPSEQVAFVTSYRNYPARFFSMHGNAFAERGSNERGWYTGVTLHPTRKIGLSAYYDQFTFPEQTSSSVFSGGGNETMIRIEVALLRNLRLAARYRRRIALENNAVVDLFGRSVRVDVPKRLDAYRVNVDFRLRGGTQLRTRFEYSEARFPLLQRGILVYEDLNFHPLPQLLLDARVVLFQTDSYHAGIGEYESDLPGALTAPILFGTGVRWYVHLRYEIGPAICVSTKYTESVRDDVKTVGSGLDELPTNRDNRLSLQVDARF